MTRERTTICESKTKLYKVWTGIKTRCYNKKRPKYPLYGGRGISVCSEWQEFEPFRDWALSNGYKEGLTIGRVDNDGNYEPGNCRWETQTEQQNNRSNNHRLKFYNSDFTLSEWSRLLNIGRETLRRRIKAGWSVRKTLTTPVRRVSV